MLSDNLRCIACPFIFVKQGKMAIRFNGKNFFAPEKRLS